MGIATAATVQIQRNALRKPKSMDRETSPNVGTVDSFAACNLCDCFFTLRAAMFRGTTLISAPVSTRKPVPDNMSATYKSVGTPVTSHLLAALRVSRAPGTWVFTTPCVLAVRCVVPTPRCGLACGRKSTCAQLNHFITAGA